MQEIVQKLGEVGKKYIYTVSLVQVGYTNEYTG